MLDNIEGTMSSLNKLQRNEEAHFFIKSKYENLYQEFDFCIKNLHFAVTIEALKDNSYALKDNSEDVQNISKLLEEQREGIK
ncbi:11617_t:CDS:2, partial [Racocetra fulgida]